MDEGTKKELKDIENMVINWTRGYVKFIDPHGGNEYLISDLNEEIHTYIIPYLGRLQQCEYLTSQELAEFSGIIGEHLVEFMNLIRELEPEEE